MWELRDNASVSEIQSWIREKQLLDVEHAHKKLAKDVPKILSLLSIWWCLSSLYAIGPRRILRFIQNTTHVVLNLVVILLLVKVILWIFNVNVVN
jgi:hypothetical protein